jgi:hypothetical protein
MVDKDPSVLAHARCCLGDSQRRDQLRTWEKSATIPQAHHANLNPSFIQIHWTGREVERY